MWSLLGIVSQLPDIYYAPSGLNLLLGYYFILAVPLLLIVPFSAFRSLASGARGSDLRAVVDFDACRRGKS